MSEFEELRDKLGQVLRAEMNSMVERGPVLLGEAKERLSAAAATVIAKHYADQIVIEQDRDDPNKINFLFPAELAERFGLPPR